ncbi:MAG: transcriptional regulator NrdR [Nanoarchaeota archaeon]|nr:transcriptional regulator NrdR [Nanoarchaeota archaeon]MBU1704270.1 transcriptional regulator NrdR [Nanoarchaeota archaeon]
MICPYCHADETKVIDSRETELGSTRRRRECLKCSKRFTTYERVEEIELTVVKKNKDRERFDRNKLVRGLMRACEKRPIKVEKIERIADEIETELRKKDTIEILSTDIGELVMDKLKELDKVAYIRFASVYREFTDLRSFEKELNKIKGAKK